MDEKELPYYQLEGQQKQIEIFVNGKSSMVPFYFCFNHLGPWSPKKGGICINHGD